jgi:hypothetical protein
MVTDDRYTVVVVPEEFRFARKGCLHVSIDLSIAKKPSNVSREGASASSLMHLGHRVVRHGEDPGLDVCMFVVSLENIPVDLQVERWHRRRDTVQVVGKQ